MHANEDVDTAGCGIHILSFYVILPPIGRLGKSATLFVPQMNIYFDDMGKIGHPPQFEAGGLSL